VYAEPTEEMQRQREQVEQRSQGNGTTGDEEDAS
jgi:hypothetical protein